MTYQISLTTTRRNEFCDITNEIYRFIEQSGVSEGICTVFVPHTTAAVTINENADPDVTSDLLRKLASLIPQNDGYLHSEGNSDAHLKASLIGNSEQILIRSGKPLLGTWQGVYFTEFDGPRSRKVWISILGGETN